MVDKKKETKEHYKVLTPADGMWLFNEAIGVFSKEVTMPLDADESVWAEVTDECKKKWEEEHQ